MLINTDIIGNHLIKGVLDGLRPERRLTVTEWADQHRYLSGVSTYEAGLYRSSRTPYLRKIMEVLSPHHPCRKIIFMKASQVGGTEIGLNWIGAIICTAPGGILMVSPTDSNAKRNSKIRIEPMIKASPLLRERIMHSRIREGGNTVLQKDFPGGFLVLTGANSTADLKSLPVRYILLDEVDEYEQNLDGQGSVIELADARQRNFPNSKMYMNSTPRQESNSIIAKEFLKTDQNYYYVVCQECGLFQKLEFSQLIYEDKTTFYDTKYKCAGCPNMIEERYKPQLLDGGYWEPENKAKLNPETMGFHLNALYSPWFPWRSIVLKWHEAQENEVNQPTFDNTILGQTHKQKGERPEFMTLYNKRVDFYKPNEPPVEVCFITVGVDVQGDRIEMEIVGWGKGKRSYSLDFRRYLGDTSQVKVWNDIAPVVGETWKRADGLILPMRLMCVDSGHAQTMVYDFCRRFDMSRVIPVKGGSDHQGVVIGNPRLVDYTKDGKKVGQVRSWNIGVSILKSELYSRLRMDAEITDQGKKIYPEKYCFFPSEGHYSGVEYFKGLCSEQLETIKKNGVIKYVWTKKEHFNEALDCRNYARAAFSILQGDRFEDHHYDLIAGESVVKKPVKKKRDEDEEEWL